MRGGRAGQDWATPSELGDFTYCRRAWFWRRHPEALPAGWIGEGPSTENAYGVAFHARMEREHASPRHAPRGPYAAALLLALGTSSVLLWWLGWLR